MVVFLVCSMFMAIPAGKLGQKYGRKTILAGLFIFMGIFLVYLVYLITGKNWAIWLALYSAEQLT